VSNTFTMEAWEPDERSTVEDDCTSWCTALLWIVPAKVAGTWRVGDQTLTLTQEFQMVSGTLGDVAIADGRLRGDVLTFTAGGRVYEGRVEGDAIVGTAGGSATFRAERVAR